MKKTIKKIDPNEGLFHWSVHLDSIDNRRDCKILPLINRQDLPKCVLMMMDGSIVAFLAIVFSILILLFN
ncbi:hypothetical protein J3U21_08860 [Gilliamella sp. B2776]|uniref:hypothetical protein n=1 Tax=unclassified Gilliamella TaxID=2685620 RepID=UPI0022698D24|nr:MULTISPECIES: hypothetical protein [unclassified Gilliamella]MCX8649543.1 hypothetical protein [Gilliamella sp. B2779]MCX8654587.1 hypothetical protein [Gilliamella sp. B2737]MCX8656504.1 hypothetical protein [Gilliamella sp. B2894]MCX8664977.1 hypothetical protein [Gilliamella sp. B2887]MCX8692262.1 hypothetical protein [Gilliamella sp. B2776]